MALPGPGRLSSLFELDFPQHLGTFDSYEDAQKTVDYLSDKQFPVQNLAIVGTDLRQVERVTGRKDWGTVVNQGLANGLSMGLIFGVMALIFYPAQSNVYLITAVAIAAAALISVVIGLIAYAVTRGRRDFTSISQVIATHYELLCEHKVTTKARELLAQMPGNKMNPFA
jgi:hypothetical protein